MNYAIMRLKGISGTNGWRSYISNDTQKQMRLDISGNGYTTVAIFSEKEVNEIKSLNTVQAIGYKNLPSKVIDFVREVF